MNLFASRTAASLVVLSAALAARADLFSYAVWDKTTQTANSVSGTIATANGPIGVTLTGGFTDVYKSYDVYRPASSWIGGLVGNAPSTANGNSDDSIRIDNATSFTLTFSKPVVNLAYALWSVGAGGSTVSYAFTQPFSLVAGGPNADFGGGSLTKSGNTVTGNEGNGTLLFSNSYSNISWDVIGAESYQVFTVGLQNAQTVPEPSAFAALGLGLVAVLRRRRK